MKISSVLTIALYVFISFSPLFCKANESISLVKQKAVNFTQIGVPASFSWAPVNYSDEIHPSTFTYDIFYYIPKNLQNKSNVNALIFNHGGGNETLTRASSIEVLKRYLPTLKKLADELGFVAVLPSANGLNWGSHTVGIMKSLAALMRDELNIDPNHLGLSGHSMGGMGIVRNYSQLADEFSFFLPQASGMDLSTLSESAIEAQLNKVFNVNYTALQGMHDVEYPIFLTRAYEQLKRVAELEAKYQIPSKFKMIIYDTDHNYKYESFKYYLNNLFKIKRDLYQRELFGTLSTGKAWKNENGINFQYQAVSRYFWIEAIRDQEAIIERINFKAKITGNQIQIDLHSKPTQFHELKIYLHSSMVNLSAPVDIFINGIKVLTRYPDLSTNYLRSMSEADASFLYEDVLRVKID